MSRMPRENKERILRIELKDHLDRVREIRKEISMLLKEEKEEKK